MRDIFQPSNCVSEADIQAYLLGKLKDADRFRIENHLLDCPLCSDAVDGYSFMQALPAKQTPITRSLPWLQVAAGFLLLSVASFLVWHQLNNSSNNLYASYFESYKSEVNLQIRSIQPGEVVPVEGTRKFFNEAIEAYERSDFETSIIAFDQYLNERPQDALAHFYLGMAYLEVDQPEQALASLQASRETDTLYFEEASWYIALAHIRMNNNDQAKTELQRLLDVPENRYHERAKKLISKL